VEDRAARAGRGEWLFCRRHQSRGNRAPWNLGEFFGQSYFCNPRGKIIAEASRNQDEIVTTDLDLDSIAEVRRAWPFYRDADQTCTAI